MLVCPRAAHPPLNQDGECCCMTDDATNTRGNFILFVYRILALHIGVYILLLYPSSVHGYIQLFLQCAVRSIKGSEVVFDV